MTNKNQFVKSIGKKVNNPYCGKILHGNEKIQSNSKSKIVNGTESIYNGRTK